MARGRKRNAYIFAPELNKRRSAGFFRALLICLALLVLSGGILNYIMDHQLVYDTQRVTVISLPGDLESWSILHMSDLHGRELGENQGIIRNALGSLRVSSIVFSGDMLGEGGDMTAFRKLLALLPEDVPKMYLPGDEDPAYLDPTPHGSVSALADWALELTQSGVMILDEPILFTRGRNGAARIWFVPEGLYSLDLGGMENAYKLQLASLTGTLTPEQAAQKRVAEYQVERVTRIREAVADIRPTDIQVAVSHAPLSEAYVGEMLRSADRSKIFSLRNVALVLAGHACAGQWRLPGKGAIYSPDYGWFPDDRLLTGYSSVGGVPQYITAGLGASKAYPMPAFRLFNSPGMAYITLTSRIN